MWSKKSWPKLYFCILLNDSKNFYWGYYRPIFNCFLETTFQKWKFGTLWLTFHNLIYSEINFTFLFKYYISNLNMVVTGWINNLEKFVFLFNPVCGSTKLDYNILNYFHYFIINYLVKMALHNLIFLFYLLIYLYKSVISIYRLVNTLNCKKYP